MTVRSDRPLSYAAAFEKPVRAAAEGGFAATSVQQLNSYAEAATKLLGPDRVLSAGWAGLEDEGLTALGERSGSFGELIGVALDKALAPSKPKATREAGRHPARA